MPLYIAANGAMPTTAELQPVGTGTSLKTMLQIATPSTRTIKVVEYGISFDGFAAALPVRVELIQTDVAATVTAHVAAGLQPLDPNASASLMTIGSTTATGYTASAEGTITATRFADAPQLVAPTTQFVKQWPLGREPVIAVSKFLRIRVKAGTGVNAYCYIVWEE